MALREVSEKKKFLILKSNTKKKEVFIIFFTLIMPRIIVKAGIHFIIESILLFYDVLMLSRLSIFYSFFCVINLIILVGFYKYFISLIFLAYFWFIIIMPSNLWCIHFLKPHESLWSLLTLFNPLISIIFRSANYFCSSHLICSVFSITFNFLSFWLHFCLEDSFIVQFYFKHSFIA
jgi:hypothetical protein